MALLHLSIWNTFLRFAALLLFGLEGVGGKHFLAGKTVASRSRRGKTDFLLTKYFRGQAGM